MPTIFSHPAPMVALSAALGAHCSFRFILFGIVCTVLPDMDVIGFRMGVKYADVLGHRGATHSLVFALFIGLVGAFFAPWLRSSRVAAFGTAFLAVGSHIVLDALTNGGLGVRPSGPWIKRATSLTGVLSKFHPSARRHSYHSVGSTYCSQNYAGSGYPALALGYWPACYGGSEAQ